MVGECARRVLEQGGRLAHRAARVDTDLVLSALDYALFSRDVRGGELIFHSRRRRRGPAGRRVAPRLPPFVSRCAVRPIGATCPSCPQIGYEMICSDRSTSL
ncbi:IS3 family transposase [Rhodococcus wratislaviensis]|uniref:IS3 family transposase n=1 Tax=Rhodococcus wratislaviensis TaxID=44752 RepID=A0A402CL40_RHOWR|nr:IS3 family transposase [Rhodococcus wratislaviensis]